VRLAECGCIGFRQQISRLVFSFDIPESLAPHGFCETISRKIWFSKNLDIKILRTKTLEVGTLGAPNRFVIRADFLVHGPYVIGEYEDEGAGAGRCGAGEDSATEDFYRGVVWKSQAVFGGAEGVGEAL
jgi:hypothetical protein